MAARPGFEPGSEDPKSPVLPLHHRAMTTRPFSIGESHAGHVKAEIDGAEGRSRTDTGLPPTVFETVASAIPPLRHETGSFIMRQFAGAGRIRGQSICSTRQLAALLALSGREETWMAGLLVE